MYIAIKMAEVCINLPKVLKKEADIYVESGLYKDNTELIVEALRYYLRNALKANVDLAVRMYESGEVSLGRASEIAGVSYEDMRQILKGRGIKIKVGPETIEEAEEELKNLERAG